MACTLSKYTYNGGKLRTNADSILFLSADIQHDLVVLANSARATPALAAKVRVGAGEAGEAQRVVLRRALPSHAESFRAQVAVSTTSRHRVIEVVLVALADGVVR
jgi:hypothetical protein